MGAGQEHLPRFEKVRWSVRPAHDQQSMIREVLAMDIGLFPLFNVKDSWARGTLKTMIYMSGEAVAACQDLGENRDLITDGVSGLLASSPAEWEQKLEWLILNPLERRHIASEGLRTIRERFSRERCFEHLIHAFRGALDSGPRQTEVAPACTPADAEDCGVAGR